MFCWFIDTYKYAALIIVEKIITIYVTKHIENDRIIFIRLTKLKWD